MNSISPLLSIINRTAPRMLLLLLLLLPSFICFERILASGPTLPADEVIALQKIAATLGKKNWNFSVDPCSGQQNWTNPNARLNFENAVTCNCSFSNNTVCHVVSIVLKAQNLPGRAPPELTELPFLQEIDLTRNYLNGTIPPEWGSMQLVNISLNGNRISGPIPKELGNISTLVNLTLEYNQLSGTIPPELGNLTILAKLFLTSNYLTGELPEELAKLTNLKDFRIGDNQFLGSIPNFIQNWTNLQKLVSQASGLNGPIPSGIASLTNLNDLRITDLNGSFTASFPPLSGATNLKTLILRSCSISGLLPDYLSVMKQLKTLDLSFNKLNGSIPSSYFDISRTQYIYLTGNFLSGAVPDWMLNIGSKIDLSYNNLTGNAVASNCQRNNLDLFASSSEGNASGIVSCLRSYQCHQNLFSFHINCGGREVKVDDGKIYQDDADSGGPSKFVQSSSNWAFSSTGHFLDDDRPKDSYTWTNSSSISGNNPELYTDARLSPLSLTYYGFCLQNGNYTVNLHFAEIMFTNDTTYSSLGRRFFDIYIQGKLVKKDFNIEDEAGGVNKAIVRNFTAVVNESTLEIHFRWAGKGTDGIPTRGVYGPLISAISVDSDFTPPHVSSLSAGAVAGIVIVVLFTVFVVLLILWWRGCLRCKDSLENDLKGLDLHTGSFTLRQIKAATNNFDVANKIGEGGFGSVYMGHLADGTTIAVKQLSSKSKQGNREFINEIGMISALQHPNLVKLYGCCIEGNQLLLIYEYMENNSLARALFGPEEHQLELDWPTRHRISVGVARGLTYLHEESRLKIVHRDIKATNVLLDKDLNPKISDFGLAKLDEEENTHISTRIAGTYGYMAPEYAMRGYLTDKADVYSFGVVLLEIVSGRSNASIKPKQDCFNLLDWANLMDEEGRLMELVDPRLGSDIDEDEVLLALHVALLCTNVSPADRPRMSYVVSMLEGRAKNLVAELSSSSKKLKAKMITDEQKVANSNEGVVELVSMDTAFTAASTSTGDLYPVNLMDTDYLENRLS